MAASTLLRMLLHYYLKRECHNRPFYLQITDSYRGNLFINNDLNITYLINLKWICALPIKALAIPY
jgi:hypothetical protein